MFSLSSFISQRVTGLGQVEAHRGHSENASNSSIRQMGSSLPFGDEGKCSLPFTEGKVMLVALGFAIEKNTQLTKTRQKGSPNWQFGRSTTLKMLSQLSWETTEGNSAGRIVLRTEHKTVIVCWECAKENQTTDEMRFVSHPTGFRAYCAASRK